MERKEKRIQKNSNTDFSMENEVSLFHQADCPNIGEQRGW